MVHDPAICPNPFTLALVRESGQTRRHQGYVREAVRAVVIRNGQYLMTFSEKESDYKFPGGGVLENETHRGALARELLEETGYSLSKVKTLLGSAMELDFSCSPDISVFRMVSFYYLCEIGDGQVPLTLDDYEKELGFTPMWVSPREALHNNKLLIHQKSAKNLFWLAREIAVLSVLIESGWK